MNVYDTIISTVGASLHGNLMRDANLKEYYESNNLQPIIKKMATEDLGDPENERIYGSEINSTVSLINNFKKIESEACLQLSNLYLLVSDTEIGTKIGTIVKGFFKENKNFSFNRVEVVKITDLSDSNENNFKKFGLRNVVKEFANIAKKHKSTLVVNATGGYKAQIAFALALGQALKFPVYYRFESFKRIIKMPPLPVSLDWGIYVKYHDFLDELEFISSSSTVDENESEFLKRINIKGVTNYASIPEVLKVFIEREKIDNEYYLFLSPMGQVFLEASREIIEHNIKLSTSNVPIEKRFKTSVKEAHSNHFLSKHPEIENLAKLDFIKNITVEDYGQRSTLKLLNAKIFDGKIKVDYGNSDGKVSLMISTTAKNEEQLLVAKNIIQDKLS